MAERKVKFFHADDAADLEKAIDNFINADFKERTLVNVSLTRESDYCWPLMAAVIYEVEEDG